MTTILIVTTIIILALVLSIGSLIAHVIRMQRELDALSRVDKEQDETVARLIVYVGNLADQVTLMQEYIKRESQNKNTQSWGNLKGEA